MASQSADRQLLFGLLALQTGLISSDQLVAAFSKWAHDKSKTLDEVLVSDRALNDAMCEVLVQLVDLHVKRHEREKRGRSSFFRLGAASGT